MNFRTYGIPAQLAAFYRQSCEPTNTTYGSRKLSNGARRCNLFFSINFKMMARMFLCPRRSRCGSGTARKCMTLHDAFLSANPYFLSFPAFWPDAENKRVKSSFPSCFTYENGGPAGGGARTHTALRPLDFESSASANSATPAIWKGTGRYGLGAQAQAC